MEVKFDLHNKYFIAWSSLIKSIPVDWKREIETIDEDIGPKTVHDKYIMMQYTNWINSTPSQQ